MLETADSDGIAAREKIAMKKHTLYRIGCPDRAMDEENGAQDLRVFKNPSFVMGIAN